MKIVHVDPRTDSLWQHLICERRSDVFHSPAWMQVLADTYGFEIQAAIVVDEDGAPQAGIAYCRVEDMRPARIVSLPFSDYCDPLADDGGAWNCLADALLVEGHSIVLRCLHNGLPLTDARFALVNRAKWHGLDLTPDLDSLWAGLESSARRAIKKAQRDGVVVRKAEHTDDLRRFFALHLGIRKYKYQMVAQPYRFFENIWEQFMAHDRGALMLAERGGETIGGVLFLEWKNTLYYKFNASDPRHVDVRPNDLVIWHGVQYGKSRGLTTLDFGLSDWDQEGLLRYKRKFASQEKTISFLRHATDRAATQPEIHMRQLLPQLTNLFTDASVPDHVTEKAGDILYRFFT